jgi:VWFA-related protein
VFIVGVKAGLLVVVLVCALPLGILRVAGEERAADERIPTFSSNVKVVNVPATVRDKSGRVVSTLTQDDFLLEEDGRRQNIKYFRRDTEMPLTLGLLVDTSLSQLNVLPEERRASYAFLDRMLREDRDKAFLIHFDFEVMLDQELTSSRETMREALNDVHGVSPDRAVWGRGGGSSDPGQRPRHSSGGTHLYDAVYLASSEVMQKQEGRKALILLTDGDDHGSRLTLARAVEQAQRADTIVYSILIADPDGPYGWLNGGYGRHGGWGRGPVFGGHGEGKKVLERISNETGGRMFEVSKKLPIEKIYAQIEEELRNQYSLGYSPVRDESSSAKTYHALRVTTKQKELRVQARAGYYETGRRE